LICRHPQPVPAEAFNGLRITTGAETLLATARDLELLDLVILGDSALHLGHCTLEELQLTAAQRRRGAPQLRATLPLLDKRSESPWESVMRVLHVAAGIEVEPQKNIYDSFGRFVARQTYGSSALDGSMSTTAMFTEKGRYTVMTWHGIGALSRSTGNEWDRHRRSCSTRAPRLSLAWTGC
jgi:hypothetical protein